MLFFICNFIILQAQSQQTEFTFDSDLEGWTTEFLPSGGTGSISWNWEPDGKADAGLNWNNRDSIHSISLGGAAVLDADVGDAPDTFNVALQSPQINITAFDDLYLRFHQYFRKSDNLANPTEVFVEFSINGNTNWNVLYQSTEIPSGFETSALDSKVLKIDNSIIETIPNIETISIRFRYTGGKYFWIVDDIGIYNEEPFPRTLPEYVGDTLTTLGYDWVSDKAVDGWPCVPNQLVVQFVDTVSIEKRAEIRDTLGAIKIDSCVCNLLETWYFPDSLNMIVPNSMFPNGGVIGINGIIAGAETSTKIEEIDYNRYNYNELIEKQSSPEDSLTSIPPGITLSSEDVLIVAILDTGIDYSHEKLFSYIHRSKELLNNEDSDGNCQKDDPLGWNFVHNNNNPMDDHSHGTHVAGIIMQNLKDNDPTLDFRIRSYKTHDLQGVAKLDDVTCATYQAIKDKAKVINDSWGFYGDPSPILSNAFDTAEINNVLIISSSGNDSIDLDTLMQFPSCYTQNNLISVGSYNYKDTSELKVKVELNTDLSNAYFSNNSNQHVDILADGVDINSTVLKGVMEKKTGTSMAAPAVSAAALYVISQGIKNYNRIKDIIYCNAFKKPSLTQDINQGRVLNWPTDMECKSSCNWYFIICCFFASLCFLFMIIRLKYIE